jgi:tetratricopeptide (TPR) repeat protein
MKLKIRKAKLKNLINKNWWMCFYRHFRGLIRLGKNNYALIDDCQWILNNGAYKDFEYFIYENMGMSYVFLKRYNLAERYLLEALNYVEQQQNGSIMMWLGYVYLIKKQHEDSLYYFKKASQYSKKGAINKWLVDHQYVQNQIEELEENIRDKYKEILTNN